MPAEQQQPESQEPEAANTDVWQRLNEQMEKLRSQSPAASDPRGLAERLAERARILRRRMERPGTEGSRLTFLAFNKKQERYGILLDDIAAVESLEHFTRVPNAANFIRGVTPWRGSILSLVDLGRLFGRPESGLADLRACVIVETGGRRLAVVAFEVEEIFSVPHADVAAAPDLPGEIAPEWVIGIHDENRLILRMSEVIEGIASSQQPDS